LDVDIDWTPLLVFHQQQELRNAVDIQLLVLAIDNHENPTANTNNGA